MKLKILVRKNYGVVLAGWCWGCGLAAGLPGH